MKPRIFLSVFLFSILIVLPYVSSAHWIVGYVEDALDGTSPNSRTVSALNMETLQEVFGVVGTNGQSGTSNVYMIDCELTSTPCEVGDKLNLTLLDDGTGHIAKQTVQLTVTGSGFDMADNISMNSPPAISSLLVEDAYSSPENEIDLTPNQTTKIYCSGVITEYDGIESLSSTMSRFYSTSSYFLEPDDNNYHYTNDSCEINESYGTSNEASVNCSFDIEYYTNPNTWNCTINTSDEASVSAQKTDQTSINTLLAIGVNSPLDFGTVNASELTNEKTIELTNFGNVKINLSLSGYGTSPGDGNSMMCSGENISIEHTKYNLSSSNNFEMTVGESEDYYSNLTSSPEIKEFNLNLRENDSVNDAKNNTYWRIYVPGDISTSCEGNIVIGATQV